MNPPGSFKFCFKISGMRAHCMQTRFRDRSGPCFITCEHTRLIQLSTCKHLIVTYLERARQYSVARLSDRCTGAVRLLTCGGGRSEFRCKTVSTASVRVQGFTSISLVVKVRVMKLEGFSRRYDEEKSFGGHSFLPAKRSRSVECRATVFSRRLASIWSEEGSRKLQKVTCILRTILKSTDKL